MKPQQSEQQIKFEAKWNDNFRKIREEFNSRHNTWFSRWILMPDWMNESSAFHKMLKEMCNNYYLAGYGDALKMVIKLQDRKDDTP